MPKAKKPHKRKTFGLSVNPSDSEDEVHNKVELLTKRVWEFYYRSKNIFPILNELLKRNK